MIKKFTNQEVNFGADCSSDYLKKRVSELAVRKILYVTGKDSFQQSGAMDFLRIHAMLKIEHRFSEFRANPNYNDLMNGLEYFQKVRPDCILAVGGGSVLDMAKLINFFGTTKIDPEGYLDGWWRPKTPFMMKLLPCIAIPTTAGSGSETTQFSVLYKNKIKHSVEHPAMIPDTVILNPELTTNMTPYLTACTGMDALSQGVESYWAVGATNESRIYAGKAIRLATAFLERAVKKPDAKSRKSMQEAAFWAGRAINISKTTICHALSYSITSHFGYPHGHAVGLLLPAVFEFHLKMGIVTTGLIDCFDCGNHKNIPAFLRNLTESIGIICLKTFLVKDIELIASEVNIERIGNNPVTLSPADLCELLIKAMAMSPSAPPRLV